MTKEEFEKSDIILSINRSIFDNYYGHIIIKKNRYRNITEERKLKIQKIKQKIDNQN